MKKVLISTLSIAALLGLCAAMFYTGALQFNRPSREAYPVRGVDVSHYQGEIDWPVLASQGIRFAYVKATEGSTYGDERFPDNWRGATGAGLRVGAYHFFCFDSPGAAQADHFCDALPAADDALPPAVDVEPYGRYRGVSDLDIPRAVAELSAWLEAVEERTGLRPVIYTTRAFHDGFIADTFPEYDLWLRSVYGRPPAKARWAFWQYSDRTRLDGYSGEEPFVD